MGGVSRSIVPVPVAVQAGKTDHALHLVQTEPGLVKRRGSREMPKQALG